MGAPLLDESATVMCSHGGQVQPTLPAPRVTLGGVEAVAAPPPWTVSGCPFPPNSGGPCVTAMWSTSTLRVTTMGQPLLMSSSVATCAPTGVPVTVVYTQQRVRAT